MQLRHLFAAKKILTGKALTAFRPFNTRPGHIKPGGLTNEIFSGLDWFPTLLAAAGNTTITSDLLKGASIGSKTFKVHLDSYNPNPILLQAKPISARKNLFIF